MGKARLVYVKAQLYRDLENRQRPRKDEKGNIIPDTAPKRSVEFEKQLLNDYKLVDYSSAMLALVGDKYFQEGDRDYAARLVLGVHGRGASDADVKLFADALADGLMARYGSSLLDLNTKLKVRVKSETPLPNGRGVRVASEFLRQGGEPVPVDYLMRNTGTGWKVFDVMVEGVSFVQTFRTQFDGPLNRKSIAQVAADLKAGKLQADAGNN